MRNKAMKTKLFILGVILIFLNLGIKAQSDDDDYEWIVGWEGEMYPEDTTNLISPEVYKLPCMSGFEDFVPHISPFYYYELEDPPIDIYAYAQPFYVDSPIALKSIVFPARKTHTIYNWNQDTIDSLGLNFFIQVLDENMNIISQFRYDSLIWNAANNSTPFFYEFKFDSSVVVNGRFYIAIANDRMPSWTSDHSLTLYGPLNWVALLLTDICDYNEYKYPLPKINLFNRDDWIYPNELEISFVVPYTLVAEMSAMLILPKIDTSYVFEDNDTNNGGVGLLNTKNIQDCINIYPNPTESIINIESSEIINSIELLNPLGKVLLEKEVNAYNYQINLNPLPQGTYFIKVITNSGQTVKKIILSN